MQHKGVTHVREHVLPISPDYTPSRWEGKEYRLSNNLFPLPMGGGEGVGGGGQSNSDPLSSEHRYPVEMSQRAISAAPVLPGRLQPALAPSGPRHAGVEAGRRC